MATFNLFRASCGFKPVGLKAELIALLFAVLFMCSGPPRALAASAAVQTAAAPTALGQEEHGPSQKAVEIARPFGFPITNSMIASWIVAAGLIVFAQVATRRMKFVPDGIQNFWEWLVESLYPGDRVNIVTDMAIPSDSIDEAKAEEARQQAEARLREKLSSQEVASVHAALAHSLAQIYVRRRHRKI